MHSTEEYQILLSACHTNPDEGRLAKIRGYMSDSIDMDHLIDLAIKEGLGGFLYKSFLKADLLETLKPYHQQKLYTIYYLTVRNNVKLLHALGKILEPLNQKGINVVLMQGISLLQQVYQDIGLRPLTDMDLWVLPHDYQILAKSLIDQGFERDSLYPNTFKKGEVLLDIHTHILWADRIKARDYLLNKRQEEIFGNTVKLDVAGWKALCLCPQDQFLYLSLHAIKHNLERLIWMVDIKSLAANWKAADWKALEKRAEELGHQKTLLYMLFTLTNIFNLKLTSVSLSYLKGWKPNLLEKRALHRRINGRPIPTWFQLVLISSGKGLHERFSFFKETLFPRPEVLRQVFANSPHVSVRQLYWKRVLQIIGVHSKIT